ncbi:EAL domain-containing protein [Dyella sp. M7H15-1]|nr:EAL domain-containing protein [Dyella sp. M7H15-1]
MSSVPDNPNLPPTTPGTIPAELRDTMERLFQAVDADSVLNTCRTALDHLGIHGELYWIAPDVEKPAVPGKLCLTNDPQSLQTLVFSGDLALLNDIASAELSWLGRLAGTRLRQLSETGRLYEAISRLAMAERLQRSLYAIAELAGTAHNMVEMMRSLHAIVGMLMYAENFYIALLDESAENITFPYSIDEIETARVPRRIGNGATEYVLKHGKPLLADRHTFEHLATTGDCLEVGAKSVCWLGVPLVWDDKVMGVLAVQSYSPKHIYDTRDQELLTFVSYHIANALQRKQTSESLKQAYVNLERRVTERTRALALANRDLREQIAERERVERRLMYATLHDSLTGLPNRTLLLQRLGQALQAYHADSNKLFAVLFIDLDRFKVINDSVGHLIGDDLLFQAGSRIRACLKTRDLVARLGGDEFAVLLEGINNTRKANVIAERIIAKLHVPFRLGVKEIFTSASIGIALPGAHYQQPEELLRDADAAMYRAKDEGRHRAALFDDRLRREVLSLLEMEGDLRRALNRHEFVPFYQPIVCLDDRRTVGYEALLRWRHPDRGLLCPGDFLAVAEENGSAENIDWQIFEQVASQASMLAGSDGFVSLNVSGRHFRLLDLDERLLTLLRTYHVNPRSLRIEVTERTLLENPAQVKRILNNLRRHGVSIALDDFGTGYSSLSYLHQYPIETLKIDRIFITELAKAGSHSLPVVRAIQVLADSLQMQVIAEGIEEEAQQHALQQIGCRYGQGFLFARPQTAEVWLGNVSTVG